MNKTNILIILFLLILYQCSKDETMPIDDLVFYSLTAEKDTLMPGEETKITASATGSLLEYYWSATQGDILGSGKEVIYTTSPCQTGTNEITCEITNGKIQSDSKTIKIVVLEE